MSDIKINVRGIDARIDSCRKHWREFDQMMAAPASLARCS